MQGMTQDGRQAEHHGDRERDRIVGKLGRKARPYRAGYCLMLRRLGLTHEQIGEVTLLSDRSVRRYLVEAEALARPAPEPDDGD